MRHMAILLLLVAGYVQAAPRIQVMALFTDKAMLSINGTNRVLSKGETSPEGVRLIEADHRRVILSIDGKQQTMALGNHIAARFTKAKKREVRIVRNNQGGYTTPGSINGRPVTFLVDTGASSVAMSDTEAKRLNIPYKRIGKPVKVMTASGSSKGYLVDLDRVQVGEIKLTKIQATVISGGGPIQVLLGMTFLSRLEMENRGNLMILRSRL